jgi:hypothetical protein
MASNKIDILDSGTATEVKRSVDDNPEEEGSTDLNPEGSNTSLGGRLSARGQSTEGYPILRVWGYFMGEKDRKAEYNVTLDSHDSLDDAREVDLSRPDWFRNCLSTEFQEPTWNEVMRRTRVRLDGLSMAYDWVPVIRVVEY